MRKHNYLLYILANKGRTVLYIGITNNIERRIHEHMNDATGFANKYHCNVLVYYEHFTQIEQAIAREKQLKKWSRVKKENLIRSINPEFRNIIAEVAG